MEPRTLTFEFGTSQPKMPFIGFIQEAPENYTIKKITVICPNSNLLKCHTEIGEDPQKMDKQTFVSGAEINRSVRLGQSVRVVIQATQFVPEGIKGQWMFEIA